MGNDEVTLNPPLAREARRGRARGELNRSWYERNTGRRVTDVRRQVKHSGPVVSVLASLGSRSSLLQKRVRRFAAFVVLAGC